MGLSDWGNVAEITMAILAGITFLIDRWPQMFKFGKPYLPKIGLGFMILAVISAGISTYATRHISSSEIQGGRGLSKEQELRVKKLIHDNIKEMQNKESSLKVKYILPQLGESAVLKLPLEDRPIIDLSDDEIRKIYKVSRSATAKILKNQAAWFGYADITDAAIETHEDYERSLFSGEKAK